MPVSNGFCGANYQAISHGRNLQCGLRAEALGERAKEQAATYFGSELQCACARGGVHQRVNPETTHGLRDAGDFAGR